MKKLITLMLTLTMAYAANACSTYLTHTIYSGDSVVFTNHSTPPVHSGAMTVIGNWNFGDATYGSGYNNHHKYTATGTYVVTLLMEWLDSASSTYVCGDTTYDSVVITSVSGSTGISGSIIRDTALGTVSFDSLTVWLITLDTASYIITAVDSVSFGTSSMYSSYSFTGVTPGNYLVKAARTIGVSGTGFEPTYHYSSLYWSGAGNVSCSTGSMTTGTDIYMQYGTTTTGPGFIGGDIRYGAGKGTGTVGAPVVGLTIYLVNSSTGKLVTATKTNATGNYQFNVPYGTYNVYPEQAPLKATPWNSISVTSSAKTVNSINFTENSKTIVPGATSVANVAENQNISIYPNPSNGIITIQWNGSMQNTANVFITNLTGQKVYQNTININSTNTELNVSTLQPGLYFINIQSGYNSYNQKLVIK